MSHAEESVREAPNPSICWYLTESSTVMVKYGARAAAKVKAELLLQGFMQILGGFVHLDLGDRMRWGDFCCAFAGGETSSAKQIDGIRKGDAMECPSPGFFVNVAAKGLSISPSPLEPTVARTPASVDFKRVRRIPRGLGDATSGEGLEDVGTTCARWRAGYRQGCLGGKDTARKWTACAINIL
jgi:hypothetical protein